MSNFSPKLEAWTRFAENALNGLLASVENTIPTESAAKMSVDYADAMTKEWEKKRDEFQKESLQSQGA
ncbi:hypothetical protein [Pseudomonas brassicacearum]|uniref:hypothetical protein n=1 Tax=Pseudomonas brassicacearum TaxID=930166 RepID=UPI0011F33D61|nr:hypothetical protein [Pseudomonas brassicacearum]QEO79843.1 hypothetical protein ELZ14_20625 [Pseudomonas brassicacearum]